MSEYNTLNNARQLVAKGFKVFPVHGVVDEGECTCEDGALCSKPGKHPKVIGWQRAASNDPRRIEQWNWDDTNVGILADGFLIIDCDGFDGMEAWEKHQIWEEEDGNLSPPTYIVKTGSGLHQYYLAEQIIGPKVGVIDSVDIRAGQSYVIGPGSVHANGQRYKVIHDREIAPAPEWMYSFAKGRRKDGVAEYENALELTNVGEGGRDNYLTKIAGVFRKRGATESEILAILRIRNTQVCQPPLPDSDLERIAHSIAQKEPDYDLLAAMVAEEKRHEKATVTDMLTFRQLMDLPEPSWVIHDVWPEGGVNVLFGEPGSRKSFLALDWALHRATGRPWHGRAVKKGRVLYVAAEGVYGMGARAQAWAEHHGVDDVPSFVMKKGAYNLLEEETFKWLRELIVNSDIDLIIYDTLRKSMTGGDENSTIEVGIMMSRLEELSVDLGTDSLLIHHTNRSGAMRGSSAILGDAYNVMELRVARGSHRLKPHKFKDAPDSWELELDFAEVAGSLVVTGATAARDDGEAVGANEQRENIETVVHLIQTLGRTQQQAAEELGISQATVSRLWRQRQMDTYVEEQQNGE